MIYAILNKDSNVVENIAESNVALDINWIETPIGSSVSIGDIYKPNRKMFFSPDGDPRMSIEAEMAQAKIQELEEENILKTAQIQALSDRNDFLEDCIAEMAGMVYA